MDTSGVNWAETLRAADEASGLAYALPWLFTADPRPGLRCRLAD